MQAGGGEAATLEASPQGQHQQQQQQHDAASTDGRSTPTLESPDTPLIAPNASLSAQTEIQIQPPLQQEVAADDVLRVGAGTYLSKLTFILRFQS